MRLISHQNVFAVIVASAFGAFVATAQPAQPKTPIVFGQTAALSGPSAKLGLQMRQGIQAAFAEAVRRGEIAPNAVQLITHDDGYEPKRAVKATLDLIDHKKVFALLGSVGTPTAKATQPLAQSRGVPFIAPLTGAAFLRAPNLTNVINVRRSYADEVELMVDRLVGDIGARRIAVLYQDDSFGQSGLRAVRSALAARKLELVSEGRFLRNTTAVKRALLAVRRGKPEAVILVAPSKAAAQFITLAEKIAFKPTFVTVSFVGATALAEDLEGYAGSVFVTQVVPLPTDQTNPLVARYRAAMAAIAPKASPSFVSLEGYIAGRLALSALSKAKRPLTRKSFLEAFHETQTFDLEGYVLKFDRARMSEPDHGAGKLFITQINSKGEILSVNSMVSNVNY